VVVGIRGRCRRRYGREFGMRVPVCFLHAHDQMSAHDLAMFFPRRVRLLASGEHPKLEQKYNTHTHMYVSRNIVLLFFTRLGGSATSRLPPSGRGGIYVVSKGKKMGREKEEGGWTRVS
jgi:hypothetical protein